MPGAGGPVAVAPAPPSTERSTSWMRFAKPIAMARRAASCREKKNGVSTSVTVGLCNTQAKKLLQGNYKMLFETLWVQLLGTYLRVHLHGSRQRRSACGLGSSRRCPPLSLLPRCCWDRSRTAASPVMRVAHRRHGSGSRHGVPQMSTGGDPVAGRRGGSCPWSGRAGLQVGRGPRCRQGGRGVSSSLALDCGGAIDGGGVRRWRQRRRRRSLLRA